MSSNTSSVMTELGHHAALHTAQESEVVADLVAAFEHSPLSLPQRLASFARYAKRQDLARFLTKYELYKLSLGANGSVVECGVFMGAGLLSWLHFSSILEPYNHSRRIFGFDTFEGFRGVSAKDEPSRSEHLKAGAFQTHQSIKEELEALATIHDHNRPLGHIPKVELVAGDACETIPAFVAEKPHVLISLLYLDFDLYEPTQAALRHLLPRVVKGGVVAFDELNCAEWPGETAALVEALDLGEVRLRRFPMDPYISYFIKGE